MLDVVHSFYLWRDECQLLFRALPHRCHTLGSGDEGRNTTSMITMGAAATAGLIAREP
jgi:hypothetical protein